MRYSFFLGGFVGFAVCAITGVAAGRTSELILRDAAIGCLVGAFLFRWFWSVVIRVFVETAFERRRAAILAAEKAQNAANPETHHT